MKPKPLDVVPLDKLHDLRESQQHQADMDNVRDGREIDLHSTYCVGHSRGANWMLSHLQAQVVFDPSAVADWIKTQCSDGAEFNYNSALELGIACARWQFEQMAAILSEREMREDLLRKELNTANELIKDYKECEFAWEQSERKIKWLEAEVERRKYFNREDVKSVCTCHLGTAGLAPRANGYCTKCGGY